MARWQLVVALCALLAVPTALAPASRLADVTYLAGLVLIVAALWWGTSRLPRPDRTPWLLLSSAASCWLVGDIVQRVMDAAGYQPHGASLPDVFWLASYPLLIAAVSRIIRMRGVPAKLLSDIRLDVFVVTIAAFVAAWHLLIAPSLDGSSFVETLTGMAYPVGDVAVFALALTLAMIPGGRATPAWLLIACLGLTLPVDFLQGVVPESTGDRLDSALLVVNALLGAAALHPARAAVTRGRALGARHPMHRWRIVLLGFSLCAVSVISTFHDPDPIRVLPSVVASVLISSTVVLRFYRAVEEREAAERAVTHQATHDQLTGAANRALLMNRLVAAVRGDAAHGGSSVLIFIDLDGFKKVNDTWGHPAGDEVLRAVTHRLRSLVRPEDTVARMGGDEFVVLCRRMDGGLGSSVAARMRAALLAPVEIGPADAHVGASVGVVTLDARMLGDGRDSFSVADDLLRRADAAMYEAKRTGGGVRSADPVAPIPA